MKSLAIVMVSTRVVVVIHLKSVLLTPANATSGFGVVSPNHLFACLDPPCNLKEDVLMYLLHSRYSKATLSFFSLERVERLVTMMSLSQVCTFFNKPALLLEDVALPL